MDVLYTKKFLLAGILVCLMSVQGVSGFSVSAVTINPPGELFAATPVTVSFDIPCKDIQLYDQMVITTDLVNPVWDTRLVTDFKDTPVRSAFPQGNSLTIPGAVFNLQGMKKGTVHIELNGMVPWGPSAGRNLLRIRQMDAEGSPYAYPSGFSLSMSILPTPTPSPLPTGTETGTPVQPTEIPSFEDLITAEPTYPSSGDLIVSEPSIAPVVSSIPAPVPDNRTPSVPASASGEPPAKASPVDPLICIGAIGCSLYVITRQASQYLRSR
jgi:hypothetical protein